MLVSNGSVTSASEISCPSGDLYSEIKHITETEIRDSCMLAQADYLGDAI